MVERIINLDLMAGQSAFLWGPRKTGKSTLLKQRFTHSMVFDFLKTDLFFEFSKRPALLREQILAKGPIEHPVILDEVQKIPQIMDEVHWLIENSGLSFILCGSSARKLARGGANLLGGRAWRYNLFPLVTAELGEYDLLQILNRGSIPVHYFSDQYKRSLRAYTLDYLKEEVFAEGLVRRVPAFSRFFDSMAFSHGEMINYSNIARDCGVNSKTVREYYQILVDTRMGYFIEPFSIRQNRQVITRAPKFYLFDIGVAGAVTRRNLVEERGTEFGKAFEHFLLTELVAYNSYREKDLVINYWRTKTRIEVDFILNHGEIAIEVKGSSRIDNKDLRSLKLFVEEFQPRKAFVVCNEKEERISGNIHIKPYRQFLEELWSDRII